jgi:geranylgeranyl transferase type-2 subunit beta
MPRPPYLIRLQERLSAGAAALDPARRERHRTFLLSQQQPDGGFRGREGDSDLYYTAFAVRGLNLLGGLTRAESERIAAYLRQSDWSNLGIIDLMNWLSLALAVQAAGGEDVLAVAPPDWRAQMLASLAAVRTADGGYAKGREGAAGSTYHSFLVLLTHELLGADIPDPDRLTQFFYDRQRDDGGFVEIAPMRRSGTNPTAAAAASLDILGAMDDELRQDLRGFLSDVRSDEGGFQANSRVPFADALSTFTGLLTAQDCGCSDLLDADRVRGWVEGQLEFPGGGFRAATWDAGADVEYTFYALGLSCLLKAT